MNDFNSHFCNLVLQQISSLKERTNFVFNINKMDLKKIIGQYQADFQLQPSQLSISLRRQKDQFLLTAIITDDKLPQSFLNIFDTVTEVFNFVKNDEGKIQIKDQILTFFVKSIKMRMIKIELNRIALPKINILQEKLEKVENRALKIEQYLHESVPKMCEKYIEEHSKKTIKTLTAEVKKLSEKVAALQSINKRQLSKEINSIISLPNNFSFLSNSSKTGERSNSNSQESKVKANKQDPFLIQFQQKANIPASKQQAQKQVKTLDFHFDIDTNNKFIDYFTISQSLFHQSTVTRINEDQQLYMLSSTNHFPQTDRHSLKIKINRITEGLIWIGLIVQKKKIEQYIGEQKDIIQFCLDGSKAIVDGKIHNISIQQFKEGQVIEMIVQIGKRRVQIFKNSRQNPLIQLTIPQSMRGVQLYPYIQMINEDDSITLL